MISNTDVEKLAKLARIAITEEEKAQFGKEIESILGYVSDIQKVAKEGERTLTIKNVMREDEPVNTDPKNLIDSAPHSEGDFITVKKILS